MRRVFSGWSCSMSPSLQLEAIAKSGLYGQNTHIFHHFESEMPNVKEDKLGLL